MDDDDAANYPEIHWLVVHNWLNKEEAMDALHFSKHFSRVVGRLLFVQVNGQFFSRELDVTINPLFASLCQPMKSIQLCASPPHMLQMRPAIEAGFIRTNTLACWEGQLLTEEDMAEFLALFDTEWRGCRKLKVCLNLESRLKKCFVSELFKVGSLCNFS